MAEKEIASITAAPGPQPGQKHRSSGDFPTDSAPPGTTSLRFSVSNTPYAADVRFEVWRDVSAGRDKTIWKDLKDGSIESYESYRQLYIVSDKDTTHDHTYTVTVYAIY
jgi:hypothetical protein